FRCFVVRNGLALASADGRHAAAVDAVSGEPVQDRIGAALGEALVISVRTAGIGMALDGDVGLGTLLETGDVLFQDRYRIRFNIGLGRIEIDTMEDDNFFLRSGHNGIPASAFLAGKARGLTGVRGGFFAQFVPTMALLALLYFCGAGGGRRR